MSIHQAINGCKKKIIQLSQAMSQFVTIKINVAFSKTFLKIMD